MFSYYAYGLGINSEIEIPEFITRDCPPDITLTIDRDTSIADHIPEAAIEQAWAMHVSRDKGLVYVQDTGLYIITDGNKIVFIPASGVTQEMVGFYAVGTVMSILLYQRKFLVLHGSVLNVEGEAVIFLGNSGDGKSTIAAALHSAGYKLINDDVAPVTLGEQPASLQPGFPQIKMSLETSQALGYDFESLPMIHPRSDKRGYRPKENFSHLPLNIRRIYVLGYGTEFSSTPIKSSLATMEVSRHSRPTTLYHKGDALHFFQCANLVKEQTIYRLERPKNLELLPKITEFIQADLKLNQAATV
ncbi:MAG: hypothetical protein AAFO95_01590 [Cyanobacteria bacterium J06600_6]